MIGLGTILAHGIPAATNLLAGFAPNLFSKTETKKGTNWNSSFGGNPAIAGNQSGAVGYNRGDNWEYDVEKPTVFAKVMQGVSAVAPLAGLLDKPVAEKGVKEKGTSRKIVSIEPIQGKQHEQGGEDVEVGGEQVEAEGGEFKVVFDDGTEAVLTADQMERYKQGESIEDIVKELPTIEEAKTDATINDQGEGGTQVPQQGESPAEETVMAYRGIVTHDPLRDRALINTLGNPLNLIKPLPIQSQGLSTKMVDQITNPVNVGPLKGRTENTDKLKTDLTKEVNYNNNLFRTNGNTKLNTLNLIDELNNPSTLVKTRDIQNVEPLRERANRVNNTPFTEGFIDSSRVESTNAFKTIESDKDSAWKFYSELVDSGHFKDGKDLKNIPETFVTVNPVTEKIKDLNTAELLGNAGTALATIVANSRLKSPEFKPIGKQAYNPVNVQKINPESALNQSNQVIASAMRATTEQGKSASDLVNNVFANTQQIVGQTNQANVDAINKEASINAQGALEVGKTNSQIDQFKTQGKFQRDVIDAEMKRDKAQSNVDAIAKVFQSVVSGKSRLTMDEINQYTDFYKTLPSKTMVDTRDMRKSRRGAKKQVKTTK